MYIYTFFRFPFISKDCCFPANPRHFRCFRRKFSPLLPTRLIKISEQTKKSLKNLHFRFIFCNFVGFLRARMRCTIYNAYAPHTNQYDYNRIR